MSDVELDSDAAARVGSAVREARRRRLPAMTQELLARKIGVSRETICRLEAGRKAYRSTIDKIVEALQLELRDLLPQSAAADRSAYPNLGASLRKLRRNRGLSLAQCASLAGVSTSALSRFERGSVCKLLASAGTTTDAYQQPCNAKYAEALGFTHLRELNEHLLKQKKLAGPLDRATEQAISKEAAERRHRDRSALRKRVKLALSRQASENGFNRNEPG
ncbi:helix-turn-helix domain-containing protein [Sphingomonas sp.]|uniref:helix-turn-helix domain-containing protein n=1 Tax=Sphingomonas sp. TaxID=28214 RepID=UPI003B0076B4